MCMPACVCAYMLMCMRVCACAYLRVQLCVRECVRANFRGIQILSLQIRHYINITYHNPYQTSLVALFYYAGNKYIHEPMPTPNPHPRLPGSLFCTFPYVLVLVRVQVLVCI